MIRTLDTPTVVVSYHTLLGLMSARKYTSAGKRGSQTCPWYSNSFVDQLSPSGMHTAATASYQEPSINSTAAKSVCACAFIGIGYLRHQELLPDSY